MPELELGLRAEVGVVAAQRGVGGDDPAGGGSVGRVGRNRCVGVAAVPVLEWMDGVGEEPGGRRSRA